MASAETGRRRIGRRHLGGRPARTRRRGASRTTALAARRGRGYRLGAMSGSVTAPGAGQGQRDPSRIERLCIERGLKMTGQRRLIARVLSEAEDHPDVEELYRRALALDSRISIATVYRTVRLLEENGILERRNFGEGRARYDPTDRGHHYHLIDVDSGRVIEFHDEAFERLADDMAKRHGFTLVGHKVELFARRPGPKRERG